jgi:hypothetical protein
MSDFDNFLNIGCHEAASIMGESIEINGQTVNAVFDEQLSEWDMVEHGDLENPETKLVIALLDVNVVPKKKERFIRVNTGETFFITEISISTGNVEMKARNETKLDV